MARKPSTQCAIFAEIGLRLSLHDHPGSRLPSWVFSLTNLVELLLLNCHTLKSIPEWIHNFKSLEDFEIDGCSSLTSLPEGMGRLMSLKKLTIENCPNLLRNTLVRIGQRLHTFQS
jgi:Leucine-rich repeat (LRR) protein